MGEKGGGGKGGGGKEEGGGEEAGVGKGRMPEGAEGKGAAVRLRIGCGCRELKGHRAEVVTTAQFQRLQTSLGL